jgi:hypothetical protein
MAMTFHKFVINDGNLIIGDVEVHYELVKDRDVSKTTGGGKWHYDRDKNIIYFYGKSIDYGKVTEEEFNNSFKQPSVEQAKIIFSEKETFEEVIAEQQLKLQQNE